MAEDLIKKYRLEEARKRFQQILEYAFVTEAGEDDQNQPQQQPPMGGGQMPPQGGGMDMGGQQPPMGGGMDMGGQQPPMDGGMDMGGQQPPMGGGMDMGGQQPPMDGGMDMGNQQPPMGGDIEQPDDMTAGMDIDDGMGNEPIEDIDMEGGAEPMQNGDEVIDVDQLTQSQETAEYKIDGVDEKLTTLLDVTNKFIDALKKNDEEIRDLRAEFEKRNPTQEEKLNIRSQASAPYGETPKDFWDTKMAQNPHYNVIYDNDIPTDKEDEEFEIRKNDVRGASDMDMYKSLEYPQQLKDVLDFD